MSAWLSVWASGFRSQTFMLEVNLLSPCYGFLSPVAQVTLICISCQGLAIPASTHKKRMTPSNLFLGKQAGGLHSVGGGPSVEAGRSEESVVLTVGSSDGHGLAKAVEIGRREEMEVPVAVFADRLPVTWKGVRAYQLVFS